MDVHNQSSLFETLQPIPIFVFLRSYKVALDSNGFQERDPMLPIPQFMTKQAKTAFL